MKRSVLVGFFLLGWNASVCFGTTVEIHVAVDGKDSASGRANAPFQTLERARDEIRRLKTMGKFLEGGIVVKVHGGVYELARPLELSAEDSGTVEAQIVWCVQPGSEARLMGGRFVEGWKLVANPDILRRLDKAAVGKVWETDLHAQGITDIGEMKPGSSWGISEPGVELFFQDEPMTLARWPNQNFIEIADVLGSTVKDIRGTKGTVEGILSVKTDRLERWAGESDIMAHGYWFFDWADQRQKVESVDPAKGIITLSKPYHVYGYRKGQWFYVYNLLCELDRPGEWYLDRAKRVLYFWPPSPLDSGKAMASLLPMLVTMKDVSHVTFQGFVLEGARGTAVTVTGGTNVTVAACVIRNCGSWAVQVLGGLHHHVVGCDIYQTGDGGVRLQGGDRKTLTPAEHSVENCHIHHYSRWNLVYKPAIQLEGAGNRAMHNLIHDAPHMGISLSGNDHVIEFNEIYRVVQESNDAGVIYAGRDLSMRGHIIRYNYVHDIVGREGRGCCGIYLDDNFCSATVYGNIFCRVPEAVMIGGGRDNLIVNNIFVDCSPAIHVDARGLGLAAADKDRLIKQLGEMPYRTPPWSAHYPQLLTLLDDQPFAPKGNVITTNLYWGGRWADIDKVAAPFVTVTNNLLDTNPEFENALARDFRLRDDSPALKIGFKQIPVEQIGLYRDPLRATWPTTLE